jgi:hypothetical protein
MRGMDWLAARGIARIAVGVGVGDIQDGEREKALGIVDRDRTTSRRSGGVASRRQPHPLERRLKALRRNAL